MICLFSSSIMLSSPLGIIFPPCYLRFEFWLQFRIGGPSTNRELHDRLLQRLIKAARLPCILDSLIDCAGKALSDFLFYGISNPLGNLFEGVFHFRL